MSFVTPFVTLARRFVPLIVAGSTMSPVAVFRVADPDDPRIADYRNGPDAQRLAGRGCSSPKGGWS